jgi:CHRD domain
MDGAKEASQGDPTARATALLTFNAAEEQMSYTLTIENAARAFTVAHIHPGRADSLAAPVVRFEELPPMNGTISGSKRVELNAILQIHTDPGAFWFQLHNCRRIDGWDNRRPAFGGHLTTRHYFSSRWRFFTLERSGVEARRFS